MKQTLCCLLACGMVLGFSTVPYAQNDSRQNYEDEMLWDDYGAEFMGSEMSGPGMRPPPPPSQFMGPPPGMGNRWTPGGMEDDSGLFAEENLFSGATTEPLGKKALRTIVEGRLLVLRNDRLKVGNVNLINDDIAEVEIVTVDDSLVSTVGVDRLKGNILPIALVKDILEEEKNKPK